ncbi:radical SAM protein [Haloimpatiens sp. FM7330]|uniref:radical SAM protein n=1 Tax=Haloimpatiens sp. FM7330 TaxID=3298610 RepID=UPI00363B5F2F
MLYEGTVYRPPSEAYSLIVQITVGCAHNKCTFCNMYKDKKFRIKSLEEVFRDLQYMKDHYGNAERIFLCDGDALVVKTEDLKKILLKIQDLFPYCERVGIYGAPRDILRKSLKELKELKELGLGIVYLGVESGSDKILKYINKGVTAEEMVKAGRKIKDSGIKLSTTLISGLGSKENWKEHAIKSAQIINNIDPDYVGLLTLMVEKDTKLYEEIQNKNFKLLTPKEIMLETRLFIENIKVTNCIFRSNHASNYVPLGGTLPKDKNLILNTIDECVKGKYRFKDEEFRAL